MEMTHKVGKTQITVKTVEADGEVYGEVFFEGGTPLLKDPGPSKQLVGRFIDGGFQPGPFSAYLISPETLRGLAALLEVWENPQ